VCSFSFGILVLLSRETVWGVLLARNRLYVEEGSIVNVWLW